MADSVRFPPNIGGSGRTYTNDANPDTGLFNGGHRRNLIPMLNDAVKAAGFTAGEAAASKSNRDAAEQFLRAMQDVAEEAGAIYQPLAAPVLDVDFVSNSCRYFDGKKMVTMPVEEAFSFQRASTALEFGPAGNLIEYGANEPAFAFDPETGEAKGSVIRGDFTNRIVYSRIQSGWPSTNLDALTGDVVTYGGEVRNLRRWIPTKEDTNHFLYTGNNVDVSPNTQYTISVCLPTNAPYRARLIFRSSSGEYPDGSGILGNGDLIDRANGWNRYKYTFATPQDCYDLQVRLYLYDGSNINFPGDGEQGLLIDHFQMVEGGQAGPIIPTSNSPATRAADRVRNNSAIKFNHRALTVYVEAEVTSPDNFRGNFFTLTNGFFGNALTLSQSNSNIARARWYVNGTAFNLTFRTSLSGLNKIAVSVDPEGLDIACNGSYEGRMDLTEAANVAMLDQIVLSNLRTLSDSYQTVNKKIKRMAVYPRVLSNAEKQGLTT